MNVHITACGRKYTFSRTQHYKSHKLAFPSLVNHLWYIFSSVMLIFLFAYNLARLILAD